MVIVQADQIDGVFDRGFFFRAGDQLRHQTDSHVLFDGQPRVKGKSLKDN